MSELLKALGTNADHISLDNASQLTVKRIRNALATINIIMSDSEIVNAIIKTFTSKGSYVSILPLSQKVKFSLPEVEKLTGMGRAERNAFVFLLTQCRSVDELKSKVNILKLEVQITGEVTPIGKSHEILDELHDDLEFMFLRRYKNVAFRAGYKKLIIKSAIASAIYGEHYGEHSDDKEGE